MATSKQDMTYARTASDIERKYNFGKSFGEVFALVDEAKRIAGEAESAVSNLDTELDQEEIFNRLTNNGQAQGIYRDENGDIYINGKYVEFVGATIGGWNIGEDGLHGDDLSILNNGSVIWESKTGGDYPAQITRQSDGSIVIFLLKDDGNYIMLRKNGLYGLPAPTSDSQAANKAYVDALVANLQSQIDEIKS